MLGAPSVPVWEALGTLPRFTLGRVFTAWSFEPLPLVLTVWAAGLYLVGVATEGFFKAPLSVVSRLAIGAGGLCFVAPSLSLAAAGLLCTVVGFAPVIVGHAGLRARLKL